MDVQRRDAWARNGGREDGWEGVHRATQGRLRRPNFISVIEVFVGAIRRFSGEIGFQPVDRYLREAGSLSRLAA